MQRTPVAIADAILRILDDPDLRASMARNARSLAVTRFSSESVAAEMQGLYRRIVHR